MATYIIFSRLDGANVPRNFQAAALPGGTQIETFGISDPATAGQVAAVGNYRTQGVSIPDTVFEMLVGALPKLMNVDGVTYDTSRVAGNDGGSSQGLLGIGGMLLQPVIATSTTTVTAASFGATVNCANTSGFLVGASIVLEPGTARAESATIKSIVTNTSITFQFGPAGALYTHSSPYPIMVGLMNAQRQAPGATGVLAVSSDGVKSTYRYAVTGITPVATPTDFVIIQGSASITGRIKQIKVSGIASTAGQLPVQLLRRSSAGTLGSATLTAITPMRLDQLNDGAPGLTVSYVQTANYSSLGTLVAQGGIERAYLNTAAGGPSTAAIFEFARLQDKAGIVRGAADFLCLNLNGAALPSGAAVDVQIETEEDYS